MENKKLILIGSSTGGPGHLEKILASLDTGFSATIIIAQHIDTIFLPSMVKRFNNICLHQVLEVIEDQELKHQAIHFTHEDITDLHYTPTKNLYIKKSTQDSYYHPSVNSLFFSASKLQSPYDILVCLLTGIGDDGAVGMLALKNNGARTLAESQESSIVYGMPKVAFDIGASTELLSLDEIIQEIKNF